MNVVQATPGVFHHFELARELELRGHLRRIYSTFPWQRLRREGIARAKVETFPWVHTPQLALNRFGLLPRRLDAWLTFHAGSTLDRWMEARLPDCDVLISMAPCLRTAALVQARGAKYVCDRGSTHRRFQAEIVAQEHRIWNLPHRPEDERDVAREDEVYRVADAIVVPSSAARASFLERGFAPQKVHAIPYGVLLDRFSPVADPPTGPGARFEVLFVGQASLRKGLPYLLQAFAALRHPGKRLRVIGAVQPELRPLLAKLPTAGVEFLGVKPQSELPAYMSSSHVLALPSVEEGLALVQGQALACGCPVVATHATGAEDLFEHGREGFILPTRSASALADALQQLADDPALRHRMSRAALARVQTIGGWREYGDRWEALIEALTAKP